MIVECLSHPELGPSRIESDRDAQCGEDCCNGMLASCVTRWCELRDPELSDRQRLTIWNRIGLHDRCRSLADSILAHAHPCPITTALGIFVAVESGNTEVIERYANDKRPLLRRPAAEPSRMTVPRVCDVCLALAMRVAGQDPRSIGMLDLRADPLWGYDPFSLGFRDIASRDLAYQAQAAVSAGTGQK